MSNHHHSNCTLNATGALRRCDCGEDGCENDKLWNDFESCAQAVARLYSDSSWRSFRGAAEGTTQLYRTSVDSYRKGFDNGLQAGRSGLAKEILAAFTTTSKFDLNVVLEVLYRNMRMSNDERRDVNHQLTMTNDVLATFQLFHQALTPPQVPHVANVTSSPHRERNPDLNQFLESQVQRHRKRQRSPASSSPNSQMKRQRKM